MMLSEGKGIVHDRISLVFFKCTVSDVYTLNSKYYWCSAICMSTDLHICHSLWSFEWSHSTPDLNCSHSFVIVYLLCAWLHWITEFPVSICSDHCVKCMIKFQIMCNFYTNLSLSFLYLGSLMYLELLHNSLSLKGCSLLNPEHMYLTSCLSVYKCAYMQIIRDLLVLHIHVHFQAVYVHSESCFAMLPIEVCRGRGSSRQ